MTTVVTPIGVSKDGLFAIDALAYKHHRVLAANTVETFAVPTDAKFVLFSCTADFYVDFAATAAVPSADVTDGSGVDLNPTVRRLNGVTNISVISESGCKLTMIFFRE